MFADVNNVRDVISNCQRKFKLIQHKKKNFNSGNGNFWYSILSRCNQIITENCNHPTRGHWMKWSSIGWHSESVGGGQHGGWGCDVWRARFFQMLYVWQPALYCEKVRRRGKTTLRVRIRNIRRWGKARRFIFSIWAIEILTFKGHQTIYLPKRRTVFKWRVVKVVNN